MVTGQSNANALEGGIVEIRRLSSLARTPLRHPGGNMADIIQQVTVKAPPESVFQVMATAEGLAHWWTRSSSGEPRVGAEYKLDFGPGYDWRGTVTRYVPHSAFELEITNAHPDWVNTRVGCELEPESKNVTRVRFWHTGWPTRNEHWQISCYCWAMYLRIMRRYLEHGELVPYENRLDV
jgi:uncharacterized protein YndB with AHSA1/START domain